jgi:hypothetical protein
MAITDCPELALHETVKLFVTVQENLYDNFRLLLLTAVPVWKRDDTVGLRFCDMPRDVRESIATLTSPADYLGTREARGTRGPRGTRNARGTRADLIA